MKKESKLEESKSYLWLALAAAAVFLLCIQLPRILDPYAIEEDLRTIFYYHRHVNPELFPTIDLAALGAIEVQVSSRIFVIETSSPGFSLIYQVASNFMSMILFSKLLAFPLMFFAVYYIYRIGEKIGGSRVALILSLAFTVSILSSTSEISILSGLHRAFAVPLTLGLIYYLLEQRYRWALVMLFLTGVFYLPTFPVALMTYGFCIINLREEGQWRITIQWRRVLELLLVTVLVVAAVFPTIFTQFGGAPEGVDSSISEEQHLLNNPDYQAGGRSPLIILFPFIGRAGLTTEAQDGLQLLILSFLALFILVIRRTSIARPPPTLMNLLYASFIGFGLAWIFILLTSSFLLYLPSRHSRVGLFLFLLIFVGINIQETMHIAGRWIMDRRQQLVWYLFPLMLGVIGMALLLPDTEENYEFDFRGPVESAIMIGLTLLLLILAFLVRRRQRQETMPKTGRTIVLPRWLTWILLGSFVFVLSLSYVSFMLPDIYSPSENLLSLFDFIETLPEDSLMGGSPCVLNSIPFYGKRPVLFSCERFPPEPQMILDGLRSYYAADGEQIFSFCRDYKVTHLVVDDNDFQNETLAEGIFFYEPYKSIIDAELEGRTDFVLDNVRDSQKLFQVGSMFVIPCDASLVDLSLSS